LNTVKTAIYNRLVADVTYLALLGVPTSAPFQTFAERVPEEPTFPEVVIVYDGGPADQDYDRTTLVTVDTVTFTAWTKDDQFETILDRIVYLMHQKPFSTGFRLILSSKTGEIFNEEFDAYGKGAIFDLHYRRATI